MRRWLLVLAVAALLALAGLLVVELLRPGAPATRAEATEAIAAELRCPDCEGLSVADSRTPAALEIQRRIDALLAEGRTPDEIRAHFTERYGEWILLSPRAPLAWVLPLLVLGLALAAFLAWLRTDARDRQSVAAPDRPAPEELERIRADAEELDA